MPITYKSRRARNRGGILTVAMLFFVMVTVAGAAILSMSTIQRIKTVRNGIDVRLMVAAEAGVESVRGRFTVIPTIQEDWSWLAAAPGWTDVGTFTINGITVDVDAQGVGGPSVPTARVRSTAVSGVRSRSVEYRIKVATFSDYAVFNAGGGTNTLGTNYKGVGNMYYGGSVSVPNTGAQIFGTATMVGSVTQGYGPGNNTATGQAWNYHFPLAAPAQNAPAIPLPTWASPWTALEDVADTLGHLYAENTVAIRLEGTNYTRWFVQRTSAAGATPSGTNWLNLNSSISTTPDVRLVGTASAITANGNYVLQSETLPIPDEGVIYVKTGTVAAAGASSLDAIAGTNTWVQATNWSATNGTAGNIPNQIGDDYDIVENNGMPGDPGAKVLLLWGTIDDRRLSIACDHKIILADTIAYQSLLTDDPNMRNFHGDGSSGKESDEALNKDGNFKEMLGVMSQQDCHLTPTWWNPRPTAQMPGDVAGELVPGHVPNDAYPMDGVYFSLFNTRPHRFQFGQPWGEFWGHGGLIAGGSYAAGMGNHFSRRNYDWDYRLAETTPPYFLRAYNASAVFLAGTWRTWEN